MKLVLALAAFFIAYSALNAYSITGVQNGVSISKDVGEFYSFCNKSQDVIYVNEVTFNPYPPKRGIPLQVNGSVDIDEDVRGGTIVLNITRGIIPIFKKLDLCDEIKSINQKCPMTAGIQSFGVSIPIPDVPKGHYIVGINATTSDGKELLCVKLNLRF